MRTCFWETGAVGFETPRSLLNLVFYYVCLHFCLRGGQEQRDLSFQQLSRIPPDRDFYDEDTYYEYVEYVSKNNQHRFRDIHSKNKSVKAYAVVTSPRCVVKILDYYYKKSATET